MRRRLGLLLTAASLAAGSALAGVGAAALAAPVAQVAEPPLLPTPQGPCGPGSVPEKGLQGQVPAADVEAGGVADGYRCNVEVVGREVGAGGYKVERYVDASGRECAYYDTTLVFGTDVASSLQAGRTPGVAVLDMTDPANPVRTAVLSTPAMQSPHESLLVNQERGLVVAVAGNPVFQVGQLDVWDASADCRTPVLRSSTPLGILGHESGFSPDGNTYWAASLGANLLTAVDLTDPALPSVVWTGPYATHGLSLSADGNRAYLAAGAGFPRNEVGLPSEADGLQVLDVSQVQARVTNPQVTEVSRLTWSSLTISQNAMPVTIGGRPYLVEVDEFAYDGTRIAGNGERVGAGRIIDISDETAPRVVSDLRLEVHQPEVRDSLAGDPGATSATGGYAGHYCGVPREVEPQIVACSFLGSGLRVFDITDPLAPREVAYHVAPVPVGGAANAAFARPTFAPERNEVWYSDGSRGLFVLRLTNGAWPSAAAPAAPAPAAPAAPVAAAPPAAAPSGALPATGLGLPVGAGIVLLTAALAARGASRRRAG